MRCFAIVYGNPMVKPPRSVRAHVIAAQFDCRHDIWCNSSSLSANKQARARISTHTGTNDPTFIAPFFYFGTFRKPGISGFSSRPIVESVTNPFAARVQVIGHVGS